jgi:hypothetical protein
VTDEMVLATTLIGTEDMVRARLRTWRDTGVDTVRLYPAGDTLAARLDNPGPGHRTRPRPGPAGQMMQQQARCGHQIHDYASCFEQLKFIGRMVCRHRD